MNLHATARPSRQRIPGHGRARSRVGTRSLL